MARISSLSVVLLNFNHARFLRESLQAIVDQSYQPLEIIAIDDASYDDSVSIIQEFAREHPSIRLVRNERNLGAMPTANLGISLAQGDYVAIAPADDPILPGFYERSMGLLARYPAAGACSASALQVTGDGARKGILKPTISCQAERFIPPGEALALLRRYGPWYVGPATIYRRQSVLDCGGFRPELGSSADSLLFIILALRYGVCYIPTPLACWRQADDSFSARTYADPQTMLRQIQRALELAADEFGDLFPRDLLAQLRSRWIYAAGMSFLDALRKTRIEGMRGFMPSASMTDRVLLTWLDISGQAHLFFFRMYFFLRLRLWGCPTVSPNPTRSQP
ncbi:MAG: glycosyltransferase family 2 protein [Elusimicrobia bacterium]|nr:glycosyltransferase family 2 protein [Elusimicrobiota bacterium]